LNEISNIAKNRNIVCHVGRVNSIQRMNLCIAAGATSFDGSGPSIFVKEAIRLSQELNNLDRQVTLFNSKIERFNIMRKK
jgi:hypothetical protein